MEHSLSSELLIIHIESKAIVLVQWLLSNRQDEPDDKSTSDPINRLPGYPHDVTTVSRFAILCDPVRFRNYSAGTQATSSNTLQRQWTCTMEGSFSARKGGSSDAAELQLWHDSRWSRAHCKHQRITAGRNDV
jgi:hypothetical protein